MTLDTRSVLVATAVGTMLQLAMVVTGHDNPTIKGLFAVGGMGFSLVAGVLYAWLARGAAPIDAAIGGAIAGALCAFLGIFVSYLYGDVPATLLALGTVSSAVTGALGGWLLRLIAGARAVT